MYMYIETDCDASIVKVKSDACYASWELETGYTFKPPKDGLIEGIELIWSKGSGVSCGNGDKHFGCDHIMMQMVEMNAAGDAMLETYYPTETTEGITVQKIRNACGGITEYDLEGYGPSSDFLQIRDPSHPYNVTTDQRFSIQFSEGQCWYQGLSGGGCAHVYFMYTGIYPFRFSF